jgi:hypothetical protein
MIRVCNNNTVGTVDFRNFLPDQEFSPIADPEADFDELCLFYQNVCLKELVKNHSFLSQNALCDPIHSFGVKKMFLPMMNKLACIFY